MAEDNNDQNVVQPQNNAQQAVPTQPADVATDNAETSVTEPIAVHDAGEQPTTTLPSVNAADSEIAPDYASAAGESTVVSGGSSTGGQSTAGASAQSQYRPAPEYGAYGTVRRRGRGPAAADERNECRAAAVWSACTQCADIADAAAEQSQSLLRQSICESAE